jgi:two-component system sensor histidine kinase VicK
MDVYDKQLHMREFDIQKMLETLKQKDRWHLYKSKSFDIQTDIRLTSPIISGDEQILFTVFQNFIDNSLKYSGERVNIQITCMDIDPRYIQIRFEDDGLGIASKELKHVFERFYRGDSQKNKKVKGYGLGLYHARMFILAHGGKINIESEVNEGTTVFVTLPRKGDIKRRFKFSHI